MRSCPSVQLQHQLLRAVQHTPESGAQQLPGILQTMRAGLLLPLQLRGQVLGPQHLHQVCTCYCCLSLSVLSLLFTETVLAG